MSDFSVKTQSLSQAANQFDSISNKIDNIADEARAIINNTRSSISYRLVEYGKATVIHSSISNSATDMRNLSKALDKSADLYEKYERIVMGKDSSKTSGNNDSKKKDIRFNHEKLFKDMLKKVGVFGIAYAAGDSFGKGITGGKWSDFLKGIKSTFDAFRKNHKIYKDIKLFSNLKPSNGKIITVWGKKLFGLESYAKTKGFLPSGASKLSTKWYNNFQKVKSAEFDDAVSKSGIIGTAISGIINGVCNYEEWKNGEISGGRAVAETIVETGVDLAVGTALGIGVGTVAATVGAPAVVAAAGVVAINAGLNFATEKLTGGEYDSFTEFASDKIIDGAEYVADKAVEVYNDVKDAAVNCVNKAAEGISAGWKKLVSIF